jgi:hypothetical protein
MRDLRADLDVIGSGEGAYGVGDRTEFCVGGPTANVRMQSHLARFLPGVSILSFTPDSPRSAAIVTADQEFRRERDSREYVLVARVKVPDGGRPLFLICGQTGITNRAAAAYLRDNVWPVRSRSPARGRRPESGVRSSAGTRRTAGTRRPRAATIPRARPR